MESKKLLYDTKDLKEVLNVGRDSVYKIVKREDFPKPVLFGNKKLWKKAEVEKWIESA